MDIYHRATPPYDRATSEVVRCPMSSSFIQGGVFNSYPPPMTGEYAKWFIQDEVFNSSPPMTGEQAKWYAALSLLLSSRAGSLIVTPPPAHPTPPATREYARWFIQDKVFNSYPPMTENKRSGTLPYVFSFRPGRGL